MLSMKKKEEVTTYAYDIDQRHRDIVSRMKIATFVCNDIHDAIEDVDLVILAVPVGSMKSVAIQISPSLKKGSIITDTGSTKNSVINDVTPFLPNNVYFIPSHPLAGTEYSGPESGFSTLFENRYWLIVYKKETEQTKKLATFLKNWAQLLRLLMQNIMIKFLLLLLIYHI